MSSSLRRWQLIHDDSSRRDIVVDIDNARICAKHVPSTSVDTWPPFTQLALRTDALRTVDGLRRLTTEFDRRFRAYRPGRNTAADDKIATGNPDRASTDTPGRDGSNAPNSTARIHCDRSPHPLWLARHRDLVLLGEPGIDREDRLVTDATAERLSELLDADALHFGYDPARLTLHLTRLAGGMPDFAWCDSRRPGPSYALNFSDNGRCTRRDPRHFALDALGLSEETSQFDRVTFLETQLADFGLDIVDPELDTVERITCFDVA